MAEINYNGVVLYNGPSLIDGSPIVIILTGLVTTSANPKTGAMLQTWILRSDIHPSEALRTGADSGICGNCPQRYQYAIETDPDTGAQQQVAIPGTRGCYVVVPNAPRSVWTCFRRGGYLTADQWTRTAGRGKSRQTLNLQQWLEHKRFAIRLGSYGDPMAAPASVWTPLVAAARNHTGYTHQWRDYPRSEAYKGFLQASCDGLSDYVEATAHGWGTFLVVPRDSAIPSGMAHCAASEERGKLTTCSLCSLCSGADTRPVSVAIHAHGAAADSFQPA